jgi:hypothetical protein
MSLSSKLELLPKLQKWSQRCYVAFGKKLTRDGTSAALPTEVRNPELCVLLHYDNSKHCTCPLNKFIYVFKVVKIFL